MIRFSILKREKEAYKDIVLKDATFGDTSAITEHN